MLGPSGGLESFGGRGLLVLLALAGCGLDERDLDERPPQTLDGRGPFGLPPSSSDAERPESASDLASGEPLRWVQVDVDGEGTVRSEPPGIDCPETCSARFARATEVLLVASGRPEQGSYFAGWQGDCSGLDDCRATLDERLEVTARFGPANVAFVTSEGYPTVQFGGWVGADALCQRHAALAGIVGNFAAWLSAPTIDAIDRIGDARGWVRTDGLAVVDGLEDLAAGRMFYPLRVDELGVDRGQTVVATGTDAFGRATLETCGVNWNDALASHVAGTTTAIDAAFTSERIASCSALFAERLYCFGTDHRVRVEPRGGPGRLAFVSEASFAAGGGLGVADEICRREAAEAGLPGSFLAELATSTALPSARFDRSGLPWRRVDGVRLAAAASEYFRPGLRESDVTVTARGRHVGGAAWYGMTNEQTFSVDTTCDDWTSLSGRGTLRPLGSTLYPGVAEERATCNGPRPIVCLQE